MKVYNCQSGCERNFTLPMCRVCVLALGAPFGASMKQYLDAETRYQRSEASPHGSKGTVRQKFQNKTFKYMRVRPVKLGYNWALLRLKQIAGEKRWEEAEIISMLREHYAGIPGKGQRLVWHPEKGKYTKHVWRNKRKRR